MTKSNEKLIKDFIDGPLQRYLTGDISFGKFKELVNETCGTNFSYSDLYPSYLFNGMIHYPHNEFMEIKPHHRSDCVEYSEGGLPCPECIPAGCSGVIQDTFIMCGEMGQYCSQECMRKANEKNTMR